MQCIGFGVYNVVFLYVQIVSVIQWVDVHEGAMLVYLQGVNFGVMADNSFSRTYGVQYIMLMVIASIFGFLVVATQRLKKNIAA
mgnify:CR=1 FL=1|jgi:hypothetical protein